MKKNILKVLITLILILLFVSVIGISKLRLDKPVFLKSYRDVTVNVFEEEGRYELLNFEVKYISNLTDERKIISINFKDYPKLDFDVYYNEGSGNFSNLDIYGIMDGDLLINNEEIIKENYGLYSVNKVYLNLNNMVEIENLDEEIILREATIKFNDGLTMDVDLGKIVLNKSNYEDYELTFKEGTSSNDGFSGTMFLIEEDLEFMKVESSLFEETEDLLDFNVSKTQYIESSDTTFFKGEKLYFNSMFYEISDLERKLYSYYIIPIMYLKDKEGEEVKAKLSSIQREPIFTYKDIYHYLKSKGEI